MPEPSIAPPGAPLELYVYYRSSPEDAEALGAAVPAMHQRLRTNFPGLGARWLRRPELREGCMTWMEVYALPSGLSAEAAQAVVAAIEQAAADLAPWLRGERKTERFLDAGAAPLPGLGGRPAPDSR